VCVSYCSSPRAILPPSRARALKIRSRSACAFSLITRPSFASRPLDSGASAEALTKLRLPRPACGAARSVRSCGALCRCVRRAEAASTVRCKQPRMMQARVKPTTQTTLGSLCCLHTQQVAQVRQRARAQVYLTMPSQRIVRGGTTRKPAVALLRLLLAALLRHSRARREPGSSEPLPFIRSASLGRPPKDSSQRRTQSGSTLCAPRTHIRATLASQRCTTASQVQQRSGMAGRTSSLPRVQP
jgi:hypothetical protein